MMLRHYIPLLFGIYLLIFGIPIVNADIKVYIQTVCEQNGGKWSDENMACNDFETFGDQDNFANALMDRDQYDELVEQCEQKGGEWSDEKVKCTIEDEEERTAFEDAICDDPGKYDSCTSFTSTNKKESKYDEEDCKADGGEWEDGWCNTDCYYEGKKVERGDRDDFCG